LSTSFLFRRKPASPDFCEAVTWDGRRGLEQLSPAFQRLRRQLVKNPDGSNRLMVGTQDPGPLFPVGHGNVVATDGWGWIATYAAEAFAREWEPADPANMGDRLGGDTYPDESCASAVCYAIASMGGHTVPVVQLRNFPIKAARVHIADFAASGRASESQLAILAVAATRLDRLCAA
jgi:hypothetical protein